MSKEEYRLIEDALEGKISRRQLIAGLIGMGMSLTAAASLLAGTGLGDAAEAATLLGAPKPKRGGTVHFGTVVPAADVDPVTMFNEGAIFTSQLSCDYLCYPRADLTLTPKLALNWHAPNPKTWVFNLRKNVKWHDGSHFTADDVAATFNRLTDPANNSGALSAFKGILSKGHTRKTGTYQVTFHLDRAYVDFPYLVSAFTYNSVILPKNYKLGSFTKGGIGTGPFILKKYVPKGSATYVRNPHYWGNHPVYPDGAVMKYYAENAALVLAMQAGDVDVFLDMPYQGSQALFGNSNIQILQNTSSAYREFHMRVDQAPFTDKRIRQAVAWSLDRNALVQGLWHGYASIGNDHAFAPSYPSAKLAVKDIPQRKQDYAKAKALLAAAGHPNGVDVTLTYENFLEIPQYAVTIQQQLKPAGINVKLNPEDQNTYYGSGANQPWLDVNMGIVDWAARGTASQTITPAYLSNGVWNSAHWHNAKYDALLAQYDRELNPAKRQQIALKAARIQYDEVPAVIAYWIKELRATTKKVHGLAKGTAANVDASGVYLS